MGLWLLPVQHGGSTVTVSAQSAHSTRDLRLDFFRGLALLFIFIDHVPGNSLSYWTLHAFGVADAAEVFVLIAGYAAFSAYAATYEREGFLGGTRRVMSRVRDVYAAHLLLLVTCTAGLALAARWFENPLYFEHVNLTPMSYDPWTAIWRAVGMFYQPGYLDILPLYVVLLAWFPVLFWLLQKSPAGALGLSVLLWIGARFGLNLPSWPETIGWFFNPFAWQLLFAIGALAALRYRQGGSLPRSKLLAVAAAVYVAFVFIVAAPWIHIPGLELPRLVPIDWIPTISKTNLSAWRLGQILALAYLVALFVPASASWLTSGWAKLVTNCGKNSLDIFCLGTVLSLIGFMVMLEGGRSWPYQVLANGAGIGSMVGVAWFLTRRKSAQRAAGASTSTDVARQASRARGEEAV